MTPTSVKVQIVPESLPSTPSWLGEVAIIAHVFTQDDLISAITERVRFTRARFGTYDVIDFVVVLLGYAVSGERTLSDFYERLKPFGQVFMALFGRERLPSESALSRYLSALDQSPVEALRTLFQEDLVARQLSGRSLGGLWDRQGQQWLVIDVDGTRQVARQRALPHTPDLPAPHRRLNEVCAKGYTGRKRGEVVRTRTTILQAHTHQWLGSFGGSGNGDYRGELLRAIEVIGSYAQAMSFPLSSVLVRLDGWYGNAAPLIDILTSGLGVIVRGKDYALLDLPSVQARLAQPPDGVSTHPESGTSRTLFDCLDVPLTQAGPRVRMIVATHPASSTPAPIGIERSGLVYEIFFTTMTPYAFTSADALHLYLHRGSFETVLAFEDLEQDPDRWVSHTPCGQEFWQILSQWIWNVRIELGQHLTPHPMRLTEFAPAQVAPQTVVAHSEVFASQTQMAPAPPPGGSPVSYGPPTFARPSYTGGFPGAAFSLQSDGTLRCPADHPLYPQERRLERNGSLRLLYAARMGHCRSCPLREQCLGKSQTKPRRVSAVFWPISSDTPEPPPVSVEALQTEVPSPSAESVPETSSVESTAVSIEAPPVEPVLVERALSPTPCPVLWGDWSRTKTRQQWLKLIRTETVLLTLEGTHTAKNHHVGEECMLSRARRAHWRLSWSERLARNARGASAPPLEVTIHGLPVSFAHALGLAIAA
jgi:hypothetical protein